MRPPTSARRCRRWSKPATSSRSCSSAAQPCTSPTNNRSHMCSLVTRAEPERDWGASAPGRLSRPTLAKEPSRQRRDFLGAYSWLNVAHGLPPPFTEEVIVLRQLDERAP